MTGRMRRRLAAGGLAVAALVTTTGCGFHGLYSTNLPGSVGGPLSGDKTYPVTAYFYTSATDGSGGGVLDLVPQASVRVNDVVVGTVRNITVVKKAECTQDPCSAPPVYAAKVDMVIKDSVSLPANSTVVLDETSLLGEKYVQFQRPTPDEAKKATQTLREVGFVNAGGDAYPNVEEVFGVLSLLLNQGGLAKLQTINTELSAALAGRESKVHDVLGQLNTFVGGLNQVRAQINGAITSLDTLSSTLNKQNTTIATALDQLGPGLKVLADEREDLVSLLTGLSNLGVVSQRIVSASVDATKQDLALLEPILTQLNAAGAALPNALEIIPDFPFARNSVAGIKGDSNNLVLDVNASSVIKSLCPANASAQVLAACSQLTSTLNTVIGSLGLPSRIDPNAATGSVASILEGGAR